jgi:hypothetical protein
MNQRRGTTLIEAVAAVLVLAIAVPPTMMLLADASGSRAEGVSVTRALFYGQAVLEQVIADNASGEAMLTVAAMEDVVDYSERLSERLVAVLGVYQDAGLSHSLAVGPLMNFDGVSSGDSATDVYRVVRVEVEYPAANGLGTLVLEHYVTQVLP